ncbi:MAG TPA: DNA mismatch repair protein MutS, partial [Anaeromyxobacter sp.]
MAKKQDKDLFHAPFAKLKERVAARPAERPAPAPPPPPPPAREPSEDELWANATSGVARIEPGPGRAGPPPPPA